MMKVNRIIGQYKGQNEGPMLVFTAGIHGNETAGIKALQETFKQLEVHKPTINGSIVGVAGNLPALKEGVRYLDKDLNRLWLTEDSNSEITECSERDEMAKTLDEVLSSQKKDVYVFDLHSTSSESTPYIMLSDTLRNRELGKMVGVPIMLGLLEHLKGMLVEATSRSGFPTILFQGGRNVDDSTVSNHLGLIWKSLKFKCQLDTSVVPGAETAIENLNQFAAVDQDHEFFEIAYSYKIKKGSKFVMNPGFKNFQAIGKNEHLATLDGENVKAPFDGNIFMPLYQAQGSEGFYIVKPIASIWIRLSRRFRLFRCHNMLHWLVGVRKINTNPLTFKVDQHVTFLWAVEVFHLLGYIKLKEDGPILYMSRRENEITPPSGEEAIEQFSDKSYLRSELEQIETEWKTPFSEV